VKTTAEHSLLGVTETNTAGRVAVCACGWASPVVPAQRGPNGGLVRDQTESEKAAAAYYRRHVREVDA